MARVLLPCDVEEWWEDKRLFLLLSHMRTIKDFDMLISSHTLKGSKGTVFFNRLTALKGLREFLANYCTAEEQKTFFTSTLPCIAKAAAFLDERVPDTGIPFLYKQEAAALVLGRKLVLSLIANAFLCTFPKSDSQLHISPFNFDHFFSFFQRKDEGRMATQAAKLKCILCYFQRVAEDRCNLSSVITLRRQMIPRSDMYSMENWLSNAFPLCPVNAEENALIEDCGSLTLQVDFANKKIGGGVLAGGRVQEEIRFCICPELLVSRLIMDHMDPNEAIVVTGMERFADYTGYGYTLKFDKEHVDESERDIFGNILTSIVCIDAVSMGNNPEKQYKLDLILRELNKAYVGFHCQQDRGDTSIELLALNVKRSSSAFIGEFSGCGQPPIPPATLPSTLGNITLSQAIVSGSEGSTPLSPIKEISESPLANSATPMFKYGNGEMTIGDFATKFTESLLGEVVQGKTSSSAPPTTRKEAPPTRKEATPTDHDLDDLATALSSSILATALRPLATTTEPADQSGRAVDDLASALTSSILSGSMGVADAKPRPQDSPSYKPPPTVNDLVGSLSSSILQSSLKTSTTSQKEGEAPPPSATEPSVAINADSAAKSIIADALSLSASVPAPSPQATPLQTSGQASDSAAVDDAVVSLADQLTSLIISDVLSQPAAPSIMLASSLSSPPPNRPAIFVQVERRGSGGVAESPRSSRSSSLTGQTITLHEYTDELVESTCREGVAIALFQAQGEEGAIEEGKSENREEIDETASEPLDKFVDSIVSTSIQDGLQQIPIEISPTEEEPPPPISYAPPTTASMPRVIKSSPVLGRHGLNLAGRKPPAFDNGDGQGNAVAPPLQPARLLLSTPSSSSRMSYAWSTASTRDEDSRPVSPTNLDQIALDLTQDVDEFSNLLSKIVVNEAIADMTRVGRSRASKKEAGSVADDDEELDETEDINSLPTTTKIDEFLSRLDQASPIPEVDEGVTFEVKDGTGKGDGGVTGSEVAAGAPYPSPWHQMRARLLRPVTTGNWGCGAFKGDPQLKSMLQWASASAAGRPQLIYCTFNLQAMKQVGEVTAHLRKKSWTVGALTAALFEYCKKPDDERKKEDIFTFLLKL